MFLSFAFRPLKALRNCTAYYYLNECGMAYLSVLGFEMEWETTIETILVEMLDENDNVISATIQDADSGRILGYKVS